MSVKQDRLTGCAAGRLSALALSGLLAVALQSAPSAATARRAWPDTSSDTRVFSDQLGESLTPQQEAFVAAHYAGSQKQTVSFARALRARDPGYLVLHYRLGLGLGYRWNGSWIRVVEGDSWVREWPSSPHAHWFYTYRGQRVLHREWGWYLVDVDDPCWRSWWTTRVRREIAANEADGLFADSYSVPSYLGGGSFSPALPAYSAVFESEWTRRIDRFSWYLRERGTGIRPVIANAGHWVNARDRVRYEVLEGVMVEGLGQWGPGDPFDESDWILQQDRVLRMSRRARAVLGQAYLAGSGDEVSRRMATASYLLSRGRRSYLCLEIDSRPEWFPEYDLDLGAAVDTLPASVVAYRQPSGLYRRRFERGVVAVNPSGVPITVTVAETAGGGSWGQVAFSGGGPLRSDADTGTCRIDVSPVDRVTVEPHDAAFLVPAR